MLRWTFGPLVFTNWVKCRGINVHTFHVANNLFQSSYLSGHGTSLIMMFKCTAMRPIWQLSPTNPTACFWTVRESPIMHRATTRTTPSGDLEPRTLKITWLFYFVHFSRSNRSKIQGPVWAHRVLKAFEIVLAFRACTARLIYANAYVYTKDIEYPGSEF